MEAFLKIVHSFPKRERERERVKHQKLIKSASLVIEKSAKYNDRQRKFLTYLTCFCSFKQLFTQVKFCLSLLHLRHIQLFFHTGKIWNYKVITILQSSQYLLVDDIYLATCLHRHLERQQRRFKKLFLGQGERSICT